LTLTIKSVGQERNNDKETTSSKSNHRFNRV